MSVIKKTATVSEIVATARIYAILSVLCAHLSFTDSVVGDLFTRLGTIGVIVFLISSGYYFLPQKFNSLKDLLKRKAKTICIPWLVLGSLVWVYNMILSPKFRSPLGYIKWIFGNGTYLYYIPILMICFFLCYKAKKMVLGGLVSLTVVSVVLTSSGVLTPVINALHITHYLNIFNWVGFFALGMLLRSISETKIVNFLTKIRVPILMLFAVAACFALRYIDGDFTYFSYVAIPYELLGCLAVFSLSTLPLVRVEFFARLSESTYAIYLIHMVLIGLLDSVFGRHVLLQAVSPVAIVLAVYVVIMIGELISLKLKIEKFYSLVTGLRTKK